MIINSKKLTFRLASLADSDFIFKLRSSKGKYINNDGFTEESNKKWISSCVERQLKGFEYYFIISDNKENVGVVRIYELNKEDKTFTWGSWILKDECSPSYAIISAIMVYAFSFDFLRMRKSYFNVRNDNVKVKSFHRKTGAKFLSQDDIDSFYLFDKSDYQKLREKYKKYVGEILWI